MWLAKTLHLHVQIIVNVLNENAINSYVCWLRVELSLEGRLIGILSKGNRDSSARSAAKRYLVVVAVKASFECFQQSVDFLLA